MAEAEAAATPAELLARLALEPSDVGDLLSDLRSAMEARVTEIVDLRDAGDPVFPVLDFDDVLAERVDPAAGDAVRSAGCVVLRRTFDPAEAQVGFAHRSLIAAGSGPSEGPEVISPP